MNIEEGYDTIITGGGLVELTCGAYLIEDAKKESLIEHYTEVGGYFRELTDIGQVFNSGIKAVETGGFLREE